MLLLQEISQFSIRQFNLIKYTYDKMLIFFHIKYIMASSSVISETSELNNVANIFADPESINDSLGHDLRIVNIENIGQNTANYNNAGTQFPFILPAGNLWAPDSFLMVEGVIQDVGGTNIAKYDPADKATHVSIQNDLMSLFSTIDIKHNNATMAEMQMQDPGECNFVSRLGDSSIEWDKAHIENNFSHIKRCPVFDAAGGNKYVSTAAAAPALAAGVTTTIASNVVVFNKTAADGAVALANVLGATATAATTDNELTYDESFERRCKITNGKAVGSYFQITGKLPISFFSNTSNKNSLITRINNTKIVFTRANNADILEDRTTAGTAKLIITSMSLYLRYVNFNFEVESMLASGIAENKKQIIQYKDVKKQFINIPAGAGKTPFTTTHTMKPALMFVGYKSPTQKNKFGWNHQDISSVSLKFNGSTFPSNPFTVSAWGDAVNGAPTTSTTPDAKRLYEMFLQSIGQFSDGAPAISFEEFKTTYCLWAFDLSGSVTGMPELDKKPLTIEVFTSFISGTATNALVMEVYSFYDKAYSIKGPNDFAEYMY